MAAPILNQPPSPKPPSGPGRQSNKALGSGNKDPANNDKNQGYYPGSTFKSPTPGEGQNGEGSAQDQGQQALSAATGLDVGNLDLNKIGEKAAKGDLKGAAGEALTELGIGKKIGDLLFLIWGILFFVTGLIPIIGLFNGLAAGIIFNLLLVSPKLVFKITKWIAFFIPGGQVLEEADKYGLDRVNITIRGVEKAGIIVMDIGFFLRHLIFVFVLLWSICKFVGVGSNVPIVGSVIDAGASVAGYVTGLPIAETRELCKKFSGVFSFVSNFSGGNSSSYSGPISIGTWIEPINQSSQKYNIDTCVMVVILKKESRGGDPTAIGHDNHDGKQDPFAQSPPLYNLNWNYSHGIGIAQLTIYTTDKWPIKGTPSRTWFGTNYTIPDFLNPTLSIDIAAHFMADNLRREHGNLHDAFRDYNGSGPRAEAYGDAAMLLYDQCKTQGF